MFKTFKEKYIELENKYDSKRYNDVVREGGIAIESLMVYLFLNFPSTLKTIQQKRLFFSFEMKFHTEKGNDFLKLISGLTIGRSISYYKQLCHVFRDENHPWLKESIVPTLNNANKIRNKFAHANKSIPDDDDASDLLDYYEEIMENLNLQDVAPESLGIPLSAYLIYISIIHSFDKTAQKEEDWKKIIADSKKIIPQLLEHLFYSKYYDISVEEKELVFADESLFSNESKNNYEEIFKRLKINIVLDNSDTNIESLIHKCTYNKKEKYDRRGVKPFTKLIEVLVNSLIGSNYKEYFSYANLVKDKYLHGNNLDDKDKAVLAIYSENLRLTPESSVRIEQEVIRVIDNELTLYQTLKLTVQEDEIEPEVSPIENTLIAMITEGAKESVIVNVAKNLNYKRDVNKLIKLHGKKKSKDVKKEDLSKDSVKENDIPESEKDKTESSKNVDMNNDIFKTLFGVGTETNTKSNDSEKEDDLSESFLNAFNTSSKDDKNSPLQSEALKIELQLTLEDITSEIVKEITYNRFVKCQICDGSGAKAGSKIEICSTCSGTGSIKEISNTLFGQMVKNIECKNCDGLGKIISDKCDNCHGEGRIEKEQIVTVTIPAGIGEGQSLKVKGYGNYNRESGDTGDLICMIKETEHEFFKRDGKDIHYDLVLTESLATSGGETIVPTLYGNVKLKIKAGIESGKILRLRGKGFPILNETGKGDMYVTVKIKTE